MTVLIMTSKVIAALVLAPLAGGLLVGLDRVITARMQRRKGPPLLQPFWDVAKLRQKQSTTVNTMTRFFTTFYLCFIAFTTVLLLVGSDILLCVFAFTLSCLFFVIVGYSSYSPFGFTGTERELLQIMCYEPMILLVAFGFFKVLGTFYVSGVFSQPSPAIIRMPLLFLGLCYVLTIKLRKSPFDLSMSHHGHQEIVKGITTELTGICMAMVEVAHWFEVVFSLGLVYLFIAYAAPYSWALALVVCLAVYFLEIVIDNAFARIKWRLAIKSSWIVTAVFGGLNILALNYIK